MESPTQPAIEPISQSKVVRESVALVDMDGTVADFDGKLQDDYKAVIGDDKVSPETEERIKSLIKKQIGWWKNLNQIGLGTAIVEHLAQIGFRIMVLTKGPVRTTSAWTEKVEWCAKYLPYADVTITHDKGLVYGKILVDDWPPYVERWLKWRPRGVVLMPDQAWNKDYSHPQVRRIDNLKTLYDMTPFLKEIYQR